MQGCPIGCSTFESVNSLETVAERRKEGNKIQVTHNISIYIS
jgi:hypothetical protein